LIPYHLELKELKLPDYDAEFIANQKGGPTKRYAAAEASPNYLI